MDANEEEICKEVIKQYDKINPEEALLTINLYMSLARAFWGKDYARNMVHHICSDFAKGDKTNETGKTEQRGFLVSAN
jgi:hypothetical protein